MASISVVVARNVSGVCVCVCVEKQDTHDDDCGAVTGKSAIIQHLYSSNWMEMKMGILGSSHVGKGNPCAGSSTTNACEAPKSIHSVLHCTSTARGIHLISRTIPVHTMDSDSQFPNWSYRTRINQRFCSIVFRTFSMSDSEKVARCPIDCTNSGDKKSMMTWLGCSPPLFIDDVCWCCCWSLYLPNWLTGTMLKATRPRDVICRLLAVTSGRMRFVEGVSGDGRKIIGLIQGISTTTTF